MFKGEDAVGDGIRREIYAVFWENFLTHYCEGVDQLAFIVSPALTLEDYVALGRLLTHQFLQTGLFNYNSLKLFYNKRLLEVFPKNI